MKKNLKPSRKSYGFNTSVSTYGKNNIRILANNFDWFNIQNDTSKKNKKGLFSDSDDSFIIQSSPKKPKIIKPIAKRKLTKAKKSLKIAKKSRDPVPKQHTLRLRDGKENTNEAVLSGSKLQITPCSVNLSGDKLSPKQVAKYTGVTTFNDMEKLLPIINDKVERVKVGQKSSQTTPCYVDLSRDVCAVKGPVVDQEKRKTTETKTCAKVSSNHGSDIIDSSLISQQPMPVLSKLHTKNINTFRRRRKNITFRITDGLSTFSFVDDCVEANDSIDSFQHSVIYGHNESIFNATALLHSSDKRFDILHPQYAVQSTPMITYETVLHHVTPLQLPDIRFEPEKRNERHRSSTPSLVTTRRRQERVVSPLLKSKIIPVLSFEEPPEISHKEQVLTSRDRVLLECNQSEPCSFDNLPYYKSLCTKLGEGVYGEVYRCCLASKQLVAVKVIPVEGNIVINGERQKQFSEVLPEIVNSSELSSLSAGTFNRTIAFINLFSVHCTFGCYPSYFLKAWDEYRDERSTDNDRPEVFNENQLYIVFEFTDGGVDMEHFQFRNATQALSVLRQTVAGLAVAEEVYQFEHRDLHWGNILVQEDKCSEIEFTICGTLHKISTQGVVARIIDFTLSRMTKGGLCLYQDLSCDPDLFKGDANVDYQFEMYRMMKAELDNDWSLFRPKTNVFWIHYLVDKFLHTVKYKNKRSKAHANALKTLRLLHKTVLDYNSCSHLLNESSLFER